MNATETAPAVYRQLSSDCEKLLRQLKLKGTMPVQQIIPTPSDWLCYNVERIETQCCVQGVRLVLELTKINEVLSSEQTDSGNKTPYYYLNLQGREAKGTGNGSILLEAAFDAKAGRPDCLLLLPYTEPSRPAREWRILSAALKSALTLLKEKI